MSLGLPKCGIGAFSSRQEVESALTELKNSDYPMDKVSVVVRDANPEDELTRSESEFVRDKTVGGLAKGALTVGALGSLTGLLVGLSTLAIPGLGAVAVAGSKVALGGLFAGGYYGTAAGGIIGAALGNGISKEQARIFDEHLAKGDYLVILNASEDELTHAESILNNQGIQQWGTYTTT